MIVFPTDVTSKRKAAAMNTLVGKVVFNDLPIMIGAGVCKTIASANKWLPTIATVSGSYTPKPRAGNSGNYLFYPSEISAFEHYKIALNSLGMPNVGNASVSAECDSVSKGNPLIISIAGFSPEDYWAGIKLFSTIKTVAAIECNLGCPNTEHHSIMSFDHVGLHQLLRSLPTSNKPIWLKLSPYSNPAELIKVSDIINGYSSKVAAVVTTNTFPNAHLPNAIDTNNGYAGLSGPALHPIALGQVRQFRSLLDEEIDIIGVGGVVDGRTLLNMFESGAAGVQMTTLPYMLDHPGHLMEYLFADGQLEAYLNKPVSV